MDPVDSLGDRGTQERLQSAQKQAEGVARRGEHGIGTVALVAPEIVSIRAVLGLHMADGGIDRGPRRFISRRMAAVTPRARPLI
jgi:hypothetical protein